MSHDKLLKILQDRFTKNMPRHTGLEWGTVQEKLLAQPASLPILEAMESTGGEPDVIGYDQDQSIFCDCAAESPAGRRSLCYDHQALESRKENKPKGSAVQMAAAMGIELLSEETYRVLQTLGEFDRKTSSWVATPSSIRSLGGAIFCDRRFDRVFTYHNGAESYYAGRAFRGQLRV